MISCDAFRSRFTTGTDDAALLEHVRGCDACLTFAAEADPDILFRAIGGDMVPPGGIDAFVGDVMREVRLRRTETTASAPAQVAWPRRLAVAATLAITVTGATLIYRHESPEPQRPAGVAHHMASVQKSLTTKPVVETYDSQNATIVEVPTAGAEDVKVVMIFDDNLPADL